MGLLLQTYAWFSLHTLNLLHKVCTRLLIHHLMEIANYLKLYRTHSQSLGLSSFAHDPAMVASNNGAQFTVLLLRMFLTSILHLISSFLFSFLIRSLKFLRQFKQKLPFNCEWMASCIIEQERTLTGTNLHKGTLQASESAQRRECSSKICHILLHCTQPPGTRVLQLAKCLTSDSRPLQVSYLQGGWSSLKTLL